MVRRAEVTGSGGVPLAAWEFSRPPGGADSAASETPGMLLLHGLMGHTAHWSAAAGRFAGDYRVVGLDQRGHGRSAKPVDGPWDRAAFVADAEAAMEQLALGPAVLIGHAMGALNAWQLAARRPDLVRALVICDMRASALGEESQFAWTQWYASWPLPFAGPGEARRWFAEEDPTLDRPSPVRGDYYAEVMAEAADGWRPVFRTEHMLQAREWWVHDAHWEDLALVRCPTLVVRGLDGELGRAEAQEMVRVLPDGHYADIPDAGHLAFLERPEAWYTVVRDFLSGVPRD